MKKEKKINNEQTNIWAISTIYGRGIIFYHIIINENLQYNHQESKQVDIVDE